MNNKRKYLILTNVYRKDLSIEVTLKELVQSTTLEVENFKVNSKVILLYGVENIRIWVMYIRHTTFSSE